MITNSDFPIRWYYGHRDAVSAMAKWLANSYLEPVGWKHVENMVDAGNGRQAGSENERIAAEDTRDVYEDVGVRDVEIQEFNFQGWSRNKSEVLAGKNGDVYHAFALPRSPAGEASGELVDIGHAMPADFEENDVDGKVVIAASNVPEGHYSRSLHRIEKYHYAIRNGAAAFILYNHIPGTVIRSGAIRGLKGAPIGEIPVVGASYEIGRKLIRRHLGEEVTVDVDVNIGPGTSQNVVGQLGPDTDEFVIVSSHIDGHDVGESAGDNAAGTGVAVEVARILAQREDELDIGLRFVGFGAEEEGFVGSGYFLNSIDREAVKAIIQNDGVARARDIKIHTNRFEGFEPAIEHVRDTYTDPVHATVEMTLGSDHWRFLEVGVPSIDVASQPVDLRGEPAYGSNSGITVTEADTFDKLDPRDLRNHAIIEAELVRYIASDDFAIAHRTEDEIRELVAEEGKTGMAEGLQINGKEGGIETPAW